MTRDERPPAPPEVPRWVTWPAFAFVAVALTALVVVPIVVQERVDDLRGELEAAEPARTLVARLRFDLVREMNSLDEILDGGGRTFSGAYLAAATDERATFAELEPLAARLGPEVSRRVAVARTLAEQWHQRVPEEAIIGGDSLDAGQMLLATERPLFEQALSAALAVDSAILAATDERRARIGRTERLGIQLTVGLGVLAALAALVVAGLVVRIRRLAAVSERRRQAAERALFESARAAEARARLLRGVTHDVKNPLGAAMGYVDLLSMGIKAPLAPEQAPLVDGIRRSLQSALAIISDLLDVARADSGGLPVRREEADLGRVVREAVEELAGMAAAAGHALELQPPPRPLRVHTDPARVRQVLENLLSNAAKYTPSPGRITVRAEAVEARAEDGAPRAGAWAIVRVTDTGPGIPPELREAVFDEFTRLDEASRTKGHGLGLAISRRIARLLGGDITITDGVGGGATFVLWLPLRDET